MWVQIPHMVRLFIILNKPINATLSNIIIYPTDLVAQEINSCVFVWETWVQIPHYLTLNCCHLLEWGSLNILLCCESQCGAVVKPTLLVISLWLRCGSKIHKCKVYLYIIQSTQSNSAHNNYQLHRLCGSVGKVLLFNFKDLSSNPTIAYDNI